MGFGLLCHIPTYSVPLVLPRGHFLFPHPRMCLRFARRSLHIQRGLLSPLLDFLLMVIHWSWAWKKWCLNIDPLSWTSFLLESFLLHYYTQIWGTLQNIADGIEPEQEHGGRSSWFLPCSKYCTYSVAFHIRKRWLVARRPDVSSILDRESSPEWKKIRLSKFLFWLLGSHHLLIDKDRKKMQHFRKNSKALCWQNAKSIEGFLSLTWVKPHPWKIFQCS